MALAILAVGSAMADNTAPTPHDYLRGISFTRPHASRPNAFTAQSTSYTNDGSLLSALVLFDKLDGSYVAFNYQVAQLNGLFKEPVRLGVTGAKQGSNTYWSGPSASYTLYSNSKFTFGVNGSLPGVNFDNGTVSLPAKLRLVPGISFSYSFN